MKLTNHRRPIHRWLFALAGSLSIITALPAQQEVGFLEKFAIAGDRGEALKQLIPGTEDYYYFHALHFQNERNLPEFKRIMGEWTGRFLKSTKRKLIENREALISHSDDPKATLEYLKREMGLSLYHQQEGKVREAKYPSALNQKEVSWQAFLDDALGRSGSVKNLGESGLYRFLEAKPKLDQQQRRDVLVALGTPDAPGLVDLIMADLKTKVSRGYGEFKIHRKLTKAQMDQLLAGKADLKNNKSFVDDYMIRLLPGPDENMSASAEVREAYLTRAEAFVAGLEAPFTSLKAHVRYQRLIHDRALGQENEKRFMAYLRLPRNVSYANPKWRQDEPEIWRYRANLGEDFRGLTDFPPANRGEEALVKSYLLKFLKGAKDRSRFAPYLGESWLRAVFAEAKITQGIGKSSDWAALLSPSQFQSLKERVDIEFDPTSKEVFGVQDDVSLSVHLKNVPKLMVKVFEINTLNYYRKMRNEISTDIDLDGLVANAREVYEYDRAPQLLNRQDFKIASIPKRRGLWVVEFIGGGKSSRAVIRKGALGILNEVTSKGQLVTVLDEKNRPLSEASVWLGGREYQCDEKGRAMLPFTNDQGMRSLVIQDSSGFATMAQIRYHREKFHLSSGMHLEQEALRTGGKAKLLMRPSLSLAGEPVSLGRIESASLDLASINLDGIPVTMTLKDLKLASDREFVHEFRVPDRVTQITATLRVKVKIASQGGRVVELTSKHSFKVNETQRGGGVSDLYLSEIGGEFRVEFLGRNGEPLSGRNLSVTLVHPHFKVHRSVTLKTTGRGAINLGALKGIGRVTVSAGNSVTRQWNLERDRRDQVPLITMKAGDDLRVPFVGGLNRREVAFFSLVREGYLADEFKRLRLERGFLRAKLPAGDYRLLLKGSGEEVKVMVAAGEASLGYVFNEARMLELPKREPSHLESVKANAKTLEIVVGGLDPLTRVHVMGTRFVPGFDPFESLGGSERSLPETGMARFMPSLYISGRNLGDELRYILERRYAKKFPGNMLGRPEILLNPWAVRETRSDEELLEAGDNFDRKSVPKAAKRVGSFSDKGGRKSDSRNSTGETSYEFLADQPVMLANLVPDRTGKLSIDLAAFGDRQQVHVLLVDPDGSTYRTLSLADRNTGIRDLRLVSKALDAKRHFTEQERVSFLKKGEKLEIPDLLSAKFEVYDDLGSIYRYYQTLKNDPVLRKFGFVSNWAGLKEEEKRVKYSEFACHELSFFVSRKDPKFFKEVVVPHLANKKDRTFMDDYLLGRGLDSYFDPYEFTRLNIVERILLSERDPKRMEALRLDLQNRMALKKVNPAEISRWFLTGLGGGGFGGTYAYGRVAEEMALNANGAVTDSLSLGGRTVQSERRGQNRAEEAKVQKKALEKLSKRIRELGVVMDSKDDPFADSEDDAFAAPEPLYRSLDPTKEWAENNYYQLPIGEQNYQLVDENHFWLDLALHGTGGGFGSRHLGAASGNFTEMMFALSFIDLPFSSPEHEDQIDKGAFRFKAGGNVLFFHREVKESGFAQERAPLLVSQSYYQVNDRFRLQDGQKTDKFITEEFVKGLVYGSQVVVTNPTSSIRRLNILTQIPKGALPVRGQRATATRALELQPYSTQRVEIDFYFPAPGEFPVYPAHLSKVGEVIAHADGLTFKVVEAPSKVDESSWDWISQWAEEKAVLDYLRVGNLHAIDLAKAAWRCRESGEFHQEVLEIFKLRGIYHPVIQGYAVAHNNKSAIRDLLLMERGFLDRCGVALECDLISVNPIQRRRYEHLEYRPLINNRAHALGGENRILNPVIREQYLDFLTVLSQRKSLNDSDLLGVTYYLFLQDRVAEALAHLRMVKPGALETRMQFDYFQAYAAFYEADLKEAGRIARKYEAYPVDRWRDRFVVLLGQIKEVEGADPGVVEEGNREQEQEAIASKEPALDLEVEGVKVLLTYENVDEVTVNYYEMDLEFLFSTNPFVSSNSSRFDIIRPNQSQAIKLAKGRKATRFELPKEYQSSNVIVEVLGGGKKVSAAVYANELRANLSETMGVLTVRHGKTAKPLSKVYVKVYADGPEGAKFFKDGYTDLRGKFDYASVSNQSLGEVGKFSILVMSEKNGATVLEAGVPQR